MRHLDLFSGIGGFAYAAEMVWENIEHIFCDNDPFAQAVLRKHWPSALIHGDIKTLAGGGAPHPVDLITGGFPCQPFSAAGKRRGTEDDRHLWPEMLRVIREFSPRWIIGENVGGLLTWNGGMVLDEVCADLEAEGYEVWPLVIPAAAVGAPHKRDRVWIIAHNPSRIRHGAKNEIPAGRHGVVGADFNAPKIIKDAERVGRGGRHYGDTARNDGQIQIARSDTALPSHSAGERGGKGKPERRPARYTETVERNTSSASDTDGNGGRAKIERRKTQSGIVTGRSGKYVTDPHTGRIRRYRREGPKEKTVARSSWKEEWTSAATRLCAMDDGLSGKLVRPRGWRNAALKAAGNAIVPQVVAEIMREIKKIDDDYFK